MDAERRGAAGWSGRRRWMAEAPETRMADLAATLCAVSPWSGAGPTTWRKSGGREKGLADGPSALGAQAAGSDPPIGRR
jgi:hypothetical protein